MQKFLKYTLEKQFPNLNIICDEELHDIFTINTSSNIIEEGNNHLEYSYSLIKSIKETPNLLVLILPYNQALLISKVSVNIKKINSLINFLNIKMNIKL